MAAAFLDVTFALLQLDVLLAVLLLVVMVMVALRGSTTAGWILVLGTVMLHGILYRPFDVGLCVRKAKDGVGLVTLLHLFNPFNTLMGS